VAAVFHEEAGRLTAALVRSLGDFDLAEECVQDALVAALEHWPREGVPDNPGAWLMTTARRKGIDRLRREKRYQEKVAELEKTSDRPMGGANSQRGSALPDERLELIFTCCHPALAREAQVALTLRSIAGLTTREIARAFLVPEATVAQRLVRAKRKIVDASIPFRVPSPDQLAERMGEVLAVLYLMFNEGYNSSFAEDPIRKDVCMEAMRLGQLLGEHPIGRHPMTAALMALMCFHAARFGARLDEDGHLLTMRHQDRGRWDRQLVGEGFRYLEESASGSEASHVHLEAGIAALHCAAETYERTNWEGIVRLYDHLMTTRPTPIVALNRAIAVGERDGAEAGLAAIGAISDVNALEGYHLLPAALGEMHLQLGHLEDARGFFERASALTSSRAERQLLQRKLAECGSG